LKFAANQLFGVVAWVKNTIWVRLVCWLLLWYKLYYSASRWSKYQSVIKLTTIRPLVFSCT
jgi:hypothetical protein